MPLNKKNAHVFHRTLFASIMESITLLKRNDNQQQGTVTAYRLFQCRRGPVNKAGETLAGGMDENHTTTWLIPTVELRRVGVNYIAPLDRFLDDQGRYWEPDATTTITARLFENYWSVPCNRVDPPPAVSGVFPTEGVV